jgi:Glyoxalase/Bleomycin resistance protein/Dioxygenase superfamily
MLVDFGQPVRGIVQAAYVVEDVDAAAAQFTAHLGVGPWFVRGPFVPAAGRLRGRPNSPTVTLARGFSGHLMVELIAQHDDGPSVFHEHGGPRRYGFHHWAIMTPTFDAEVARYRRAGFEEAFYDVLPSGARVMYVDSTPALPGMIEIVELNDAQHRVYTEIHRASLGWSGADPVRREPPPQATTR